MGYHMYLQVAVGQMVGLQFSVICGPRPSVLGQDRSETPKIGLGLGLGLAGLTLCCETQPCHARRHNDLEGHSNFSIYSFSVLCLNITTVDINSGVHLLKS